MNILVNIFVFIHHVSRWIFSNVLPYMVLVLITLVFLAMLVLLLMPRLLIILYVKYKKLTSQFSQKYVKLDRNTWCSYLERGNIDTTIATVVFLHGLSGSSVDFVPMAPLICKAYHLVAIDCLNHGNSTKLNRVVEIDDLTGFLKKFIEKSGLYRRKVHLVGYSLGGCIATTYTATYPEDVASLIVCCPFIKKEDGYVNHFKQEGFVPKTKEDFAELWHFLSSGKIKPLPTIMLAALWDYKNSVGPMQRLVGDGISKHSISPELLENILQNVLIIWGDDDKLLPPKGAEYLKEHLYSAKVEYVKEAGHLMGSTHLKEMTKLIADWLPEQTVERTVSVSEGNAEWQILSLK